jgi:hypothetical protein
VLAIIICVSLVVILFLLASGLIGRDWGYNVSEGVTIITMVLLLVLGCFFGLHEERVTHTPVQKVQISKTASAMLVEADGQTETWEDAKRYNTITEKTPMVIRKSWNHFGIPVDDSIQLAK